MDTDIGRKLDKGNEYLGEIKGDTSALPDMKKGIENLNVKFDSSLIEQKGYNQEMREHNQWMKEHLIKMDEYNKEHNQRLEKILEKLAEKFGKDKVDDNV
jgi:hypothetical protein